MKGLSLLISLILSVSAAFAQPEVVKRVQGKWEVETSTEKAFTESKTVVWTIDVVPDSIIVTKEDEIGRIEKVERYHIDSMAVGPKGFLAHVSKSDDKTGTVKHTNTCQFVLSDDGWTCSWIINLETKSFSDTVYLFHRTKKRL